MPNDSKYGRLYPERAIEPIVAAAHEYIDSAGLSEVKRQAFIDALDNIDEESFPPDEPLFLLRGQDALAGEFVHAYAQMVRDHPEASVRGLDADHIDAFADAMDNWTPRKLPD